MDDCSLRGHPGPMNAPCRGVLGPTLGLKLWPFCACQLEGGLGGGDMVSGRSSSLPNSLHPELMDLARNLGAQLKFMP